MSIDAMKQALSALETCKVYDEADAWFDIDKVEEAAEALRLAIEQAEFDAAHETLEREAGIHISQQQAERQEPVALERMQRGMAILDWNRAQEEPPIAVTKELWVAEQLERFYTAPPQRQPLTDEEKAKLCKQFPYTLTFNAIRAIERAHGIGGGE